MKVTKQYHTRIQTITVITTCIALTIMDHAWTGKCNPISKANSINNTLMHAPLVHVLVHTCPCTCVGLTVHGQGWDTTPSTTKHIKHIN